ncbi:MAG TPA: PfkB family carbohydrate kinase [Bryobacterales bacterium]|nr:PfkB family carbohydrate kinase [Bryobacterales bacterium]
MSLVVVGSVAYDGIETPHGKVDRLLGGSATYIALAASFFAPVKVVAVVGEDFDPADARLLEEHDIDLTGLEKRPGKTFYWAGVYSEDLNDRTTLTTDLNVFADFNPQLPEEYRSSPYLFLGNIQPSLQARVQRQMENACLVGGDTMNLWIRETPDELAATLREWDVLLINDSEARMLSGENNLRRAAEKILAMGPHTLIIKRGEYGAVLFREEGYFLTPGFPLESVFDPTGAGDSFAGGFMGYLAGCGAHPDTHAALRRAVIYGSVMGSFCCEEFGVQRLARLTRREIDGRYREFQAFTHF